MWHSPCHESQCRDQNWVKSARRSCAIYSKLMMTYVCVFHPALCNPFVCYEQPLYEARDTMYFGTYFLLSAPSWYLLTEYQRSRAYETLNFTFLVDPSTSLLLSIHSPSQKENQQWTSLLWEFRILSSRLAQKWYNCCCLATECFASSNHLAMGEKLVYLGCNHFINTWHLGAVCPRALCV